MVNHPARSQKTLEAAVRRLLNYHAISRIEFSTNGRDGVMARAIPETWHPLVKARRDAAFLAHESAGRDSISLREAEKITAESMAPVARVNAPSFVDAVAKLGVELGGEG